VLRELSLARLWGKDPIAAITRFWCNQTVVKMVSLGQAVFWWKTACFFSSAGGEQPIVEERSLRENAFSFNPLFIGGRSLEPERLLNRGRSYHFGLGFFLKVNCS